MRPKSFYANKDVAIYVNYVMGKDSGGLRLNVDWYKFDARGKMYVIDRKQEYFVSKEAEGQWKRILG